MARTNFNEDNPGLEWNYIQIPEESNYSLSDRPGYLRLKGTARTINCNSSPTFIGRRVTDLDFSATTKIEFNPLAENEEAGIILLNNGMHFDLMVIEEAEKRYLQVKLKFGSIVYKSEKVEIRPGAVSLRIKGETSTYSFQYAQGDDDFKEIEKVNSRYLSTETAGGFTGVYVGLYATGNGKQSEAAADFDWFEYKTKE